MCVCVCISFLCVCVHFFFVCVLHFYGTNIITCVLFWWFEQITVNRNIYLKKKKHNSRTICAYITFLNAQSLVTIFFSIHTIVIRGVQCSFKISFGKLHKYELLCFCVWVYAYKGMAECLNSYPKGWLTRRLMPKRLRFRGTHRISVEPASEPSEIIYKNLQYGEFNKMARKLFTLFLAVVTIAVSCSMILGASLYRQNNTKQQTYAILYF